MLSQFTREVPCHVTLADLDFRFEKDVYPVGRLDHDSEGLLMLTNDKSLNQKILNPKNKQPKTYWAQVEGLPTQEDLKQFKKGITIRIKGKVHHCRHAEASLLEDELNIPERNPPIRERKNIPASWISITLTEGKNRQVRRMCAAIGYPVLRLIRTEVAGLVYHQGPLSDISVGEVIDVSDLIKN